MGAAVVPEARAVDVGCWGAENLCAERAEFGRVAMAPRLRHRHLVSMVQTPCRSGFLSIAHNMTGFCSCAVRFIHTSCSLEVGNKPDRPCATKTGHIMCSRH